MISNINALLFGNQTRASNHNDDYHQSSVNNTTGMIENPRNRTRRRTKKWNVKSRYKLVEPVGKGSYGEVVKAVDK